MNMEEGATWRWLRGHDAVQRSREAIVRLVERWGVVNAASMAGRDERGMFVTQREPFDVGWRGVCLDFWNLDRDEVGDGQVTRQASPKFNHNVGK